MNSIDKQTALIIGSGVGGLATAIRLACQGFEVTIFEKNSYPGGKISELTMGAYRFDKGPSLLTLPELIVELQTLCGYEKPFLFKRLQNITNYFFPDGTRVNATGSIKDFSQELSLKLGENPQVVEKYFQKSRFYFQSTYNLFLNKSLGKLSNFINLETFITILKAPRLGLFRSMHSQNQKTFQNSKTVQIFDRYATYNGSNPYEAPAILNQIQHLEFELGAFAPENGMQDITSYLYNLALHCGVKFKFNENVQKIETKDGNVSGIVSNMIFHQSKLIVCNTDIHHAYSKLIPGKYKPKRILSQQKSSSAFVFFWGINRSYPELGVHNILFSSDYQREFRKLFTGMAPDSDPTIYINITSKYKVTDAPEGHENWFVMVNVPHNASQKEVTYQQELRRNVIAKIDKVLRTNIEKHIVAESLLDPNKIELETSSFGGSLYGNSSNNRFAAFRRHHNFHSQLKGLYFVGGSVHPGGGIPLCLLGAKITSVLIAKDYAYEY